MELVDSEELAANAERDLQLSGVLQVATVAAGVGRDEGAAIPVESKDHWKRY